MASKRNNDKGLITFIFTIITTVLGAGSAIAAIVGLTTGSLAGIIIGIIWLLGGLYFLYESFMIILGKKSNSWLYVVLSFIFAAIIGGILMLIAKILN